ncbi:MAG: alpha/beta hydrolase [Flavobacteriales bacterium]|nr:alpha/beta hydrolase [Flavobacteriales bacterium]
MSKKKQHTPLPFRILFASFPFLEKYLPSFARFLVVRLFFTPFRFKPRPGEESLLKKSTEFELQINGNKVLGRFWGKGPIAILVHGWSGRGMQLRYFVEPLLAEGFQVITFDAPGHGRSQGKDSSLLEFHDTLVEIQKQFGDFELGIGHSLGGASLLYSSKEGLCVNQLITISTPVLPERIVTEFLRRINASEKMSSSIDNYVLKRTGNPFDYYSGIKNVTFLRDKAILAFHDHDDKEAEIEHAFAMREVHGNVELIETYKLGHNRILKSELVINGIRKKAEQLQNRTITH